MTHRRYRHYKVCSLMQSTLSKIILRHSQWVEVPLEVNPRMLQNIVKPSKASQDG